MQLVKSVKKDLYEQISQQAHALVSQVINLAIRREQKN